MGRRRARWSRFRAGDSAPAATGGYVLRHVDDAQARDLGVSEDPARRARSPSSPKRRVQAAQELAEPAARLGAQGRGRARPRDRDELPLPGRRRPLVPLPGGAGSSSRASGENAARQSGIYKRVQRLSDEGVQDAARACCEDAVCLKKTLWDVDEETPLGMDRGEGEIPCPEPCSVFVSFARRVRLFEAREADRDAAGLSPSEREDLAALVEAAATGRGRVRPRGRVREAAERAQDALQEAHPRAEAARGWIARPRSPRKPILPPTTRCSPSWFAEHSGRQRKGHIGDQRKLVLVRGDAARERRKRRRRGTMLRRS